MAVKSSSSTRRVRAISAAQSASIKQITGLSTAYAALPMTTKSGWQAAANVLNAQQGRTGLHKLCAANVYVSVNSALRACGMADNDTAPTDLSLPGEMPTVTVATYVDGESFVLDLNCPGYSNAAVVVEAANGVAAGKISTADSAFAPMLFLPSGLGTLTPLTTAYVDVWGVQEVGAQIAVRLTAITPAGIRGVPYMVEGVVGVESAEAAQPEPELQKAA